jgi:acetolactate synthase I/II/III large subunit
MAHGYYMITGEPAVVMVHTTVGTANALGGLINAARSRIPLVLTAGRTPITERGFLGSRDNFIHWAQESFDQGAMVREFVKWDYELRSFAQLESVVRRAFTIAMTDPKGPVYLTLPREVLAEAHDEIVFDESPIVPAAPPHPNPQAIEQAAALLARAESPVIITRAAGAAPDAVAALVGLAESFALPVVESSQPEYMNFPSDHPLHQGFDPAPFLSSADVILVVQCDVPWFPSAESPKPDARVIHVGVDPLHGRYPVWGFPADLAITSRPATALRLLAESLTRLRDGCETKIAERFERLSAAHDRQGESWRNEARSKGSAPAITLEWVSSCLSRLNDDVLMVNEYDLKLPYYGARAPGNYFSVSAAGSLGWGIGAALGAKLAAPEKNVVAVVGDGAYIFNNPSACHMISAMYQLPILVVVCNNGGWNAPKAATRAVHPKGWAVRTENFPLTRFTTDPKYEMMVQAYGGYGEAVSEPSELPAALARAFKVVKEEKRQAVVHVVCASPGAPF